MGNLYLYDGKIAMLNNAIVLNESGPVYPTQSIVSRWNFLNGNRIDDINAKTMSIYTGRTNYEFVTGPDGTNNGLHLSDKGGTGLKGANCNNTLYDSKLTNALPFSISMFVKINELCGMDPSAGLFSIQPTISLNDIVGWRTDGSKQYFSYANTWSDSFDYSFSLDTWYHIVMAKTPDALASYYINGEFKGVVNNGQTIGATSRKLILGNYGSCLGYIHNVTYAYVYVYGKQLEDEEILQLYNDGNGC